MTDKGRAAIEAAAKAVRNNSGVTGDAALRVAHEALKAYLAALPGWRLVPVYPRGEMWDCLGEQDIAEQKRWSGDFGNFAALMREIANAAPPPPGLGD